MNFLLLVKFRKTLQIKFFLCQILFESRHFFDSLFLFFMIYFFNKRLQSLVGSLERCLAKIRNTCKISFCKELSLPILFIKREFSIKHFQDRRLIYELSYCSKNFAQQFAYRFKLLAFPLFHSKRQNSCENY